MSDVDVWHISREAKTNGAPSVGLEYFRGRPVSEAQMCCLVGNELMTIVTSPLVDFCGYFPLGPTPGNSAQGCMLIEAGNPYSVDAFRGICRLHLCAPDSS